jgi:hypothetical protein
MHVVVVTELGLRPFVQIRSKHVILVLLCVCVYVVRSGLVGRAAFFDHLLRCIIV